MTFRIRLRTTCDYSLVATWNTSQLKACGRLLSPRFPANQYAAANALWGKQIISSRQGQRKGEDWVAPQKSDASSHKYHQQLLSHKSAARSFAVMTWVTLPRRCSLYKVRAPQISPLMPPGCPTSFLVPPFRGVRPSLPLAKNGHRVAAEDGDGLEMEMEMAKANAKAKAMVLKMKMKMELRLERLELMLKMVKGLGSGSVLAAVWSRVWGSGVGLANFYSAFINSPVVQRCGGHWAVIC